MLKRLLVILNNLENLNGTRVDGKIIKAILVEKVKQDQSLVSEMKKPTIFDRI